MSDTIVFDAKLMRPACVLLQAAMGGSIEAAHRFPSELWLTAPTPDMKRYRVESKEQLDQLVQKTVRAHQDAGAPAPNRPRDKRRARVRSR